MGVFLLELLLVELLEARSARRRRAALEREREHVRACAQAWADAARDALG